MLLLVTLRGNGLLNCTMIWLHNHQRLRTPRDGLISCKSICARHFHFLILEVEVNFSRLKMEDIDLQWWNFDHWIKSPYYWLSHYLPATKQSFSLGRTSSFLQSERMKKENENSLHVYASLNIDEFCYESTTHENFKTTGFLMLRATRVFLWILRHRATKIGGDWFQGGSVPTLKSSIRLDGVNSQSLDREPIMFTLELD